MFQVRAKFEFRNTIAVAMLTGKKPCSCVARARCDSISNGRDQHQATDVERPILRLCGREGHSNARQECSEPDRNRQE